MADMVVAFHIVCSGEKFTYEVSLLLPRDARMERLCKAQDQAFKLFAHCIDAEASSEEGTCNGPHTLWMESLTRSIVLDSTREGWIGMLPTVPVPA